MQDTKQRSLHLLAAALLILFISGDLDAQASAPTINQLFGFSCDPNTKICADGQAPNALLQSADGNFYGTTPVGGAGNVTGGGTVFKITAGGQFTLLYTFAADQNGDYPNGNEPTDLVEGNDGFLYGTTLLGGSHNTGLVFKISKTGKFRILNSAVGYQGYGPTTLVLGADGNLYGGTFGNGTVGGSLFRVTPNGAYALLHALSPQVEGPMALGLTQASDGNFYGTTLGGEELLTTLFRLTPSGQFTVLQTLHYGQFPVSAPIEASNGKLYGGLSRFEDQAEAGLFGSNLSGSSFENILLPALAFGDYVQYLTAASDANLWGVIPAGVGDFPNGGVVGVSVKGKQIQSVSFDGTNGMFPDAPLVQGSNGRFFGVTESGGSVTGGDVASGVVFTLDAGLAAPKAGVVAFKPARGKVGQHVMIHGIHFVGTTAVTFNGVSAKFKVLNTGNIVAAVPQGATTGPISVTNPGGTTVSRGNFTVE
jgi:uncharacterized repeat protein (TIGR03803 family)